MTDENTEVIVENAEEQEAPASAAAITPTEGIDALRAQLEAERAARVAAEQRASTAERTAVEAQGRAQDSDLQTVVNALGRTTDKAVALKQQYADAMSASEWEQAAELQEQISRNEAIRLQLEQGKAALESQPKPAIKPAEHSDPVEAVASRLTPRSAAWVRAHPEFARDPKKLQKMVSAHNFVMADENAPVADSKEYFSAVEKLLGVGSENTEARPTTTATTTETNADAPLAAAATATGGRNAAPVAAPVSRSGTGSRTQVVRLTSAQREAAAASGMTEQEYAKALEKLKAEGRIN